MTSTIAAETVSLPGPTGEHNRDDGPKGTSQDDPAAGTNSSATNKTVVEKVKENATDHKKDGLSTNGSVATKTAGPKSGPPAPSIDRTAASNNGVNKRTEEEEKLRKRLHAKREEDRLRDLIKRKRDSFRQATNLTNGGTNNPENHDKNVEDQDQKDEKKSDKTMDADSGKNGEKVSGNTVETGKDDRKESRRRDVDTKDPELSNGHDRRPRDRHRSHEDTYDHRSHRSSSDRQGRDRRRPPYHPPPVVRGRDARVVPGPAPPPARGPYNHSYYDSRRPPPPHHHHHPEEPYPPTYHRHERGRDGHRGRPPRVEDDIDRFGRQRRFANGSDQSSNRDRGNKMSSGSESRRRQSLSSSASNDAGYHRKRSRSRSRSVSSSGSSRSGSSYSRSSDDDSSRHGSRSRKHRRSSSSSRSSRRSEGSSVSGSKSQSSSSSVSFCKENTGKEIDEDMEEDPIEYSKDQRTIFVTQLVMRTTVKDLSKFFKHHGIKVNDIELLRDRRSGQHKGSAYVEMKRMIDVKKAVELSGQAPTFQRFPILIKESEAERNLPPSALSIAPVAAAAALNNPAAGITPALVATMQLQLQKQSIKLPPLKDANGQLIQSQKVYVGNLEVNVVTAQHLQLLFAPFGTLTEVQLQNGKGFAFLQFYDPKEAALAIQSMAGQVLAGRPMKTGWATNPVISINGVAVVTSNEFPADAAIRVQNAYQILAQLTLATSALPAPAMVPYLGVRSSVTTSSVPTVADARASLAATMVNKNNPVINPTVTVPTTVPTIATDSSKMVVDPMKIGNVENPSQHVLVHNMFNKDEETDVGWENDLREEFIEECGKYGTIVNVIVVSREAGGKIYTSFSDVTGAQTCARSLAGRWFDRRQLRVEYVTDEQVKAIEKEYPLSTSAGVPASSTH